MKKIKKILSVMIIILLLISICKSTLALSDDLDKYKPSKYEDKTLNQDLIDKTAIVLTAVRTIGVAVSVITLMIIGIKYMLGSVEEKANYKKDLLPWVIGSMILAIGTSLVEFIYTTFHT